MRVLSQEFGKRGLYRDDFKNIEKFQDYLLICLKHTNRILNRTAPIKSSLPLLETLQPLCASCSSYTICTSMSLYTVAIHSTKNVSTVARGLRIFVLGAT